MAESFEPEPTVRVSGQPVDRRSQQAADSEHRWAAFMTHAAHVLASSLDFRTTVDNILDLLVPQLADWCIAHVLNEESKVLEVAVAHADPVRDELLHEIVARYRLEPGRPFLSGLLDPPRPVLLREVTDVLLRAELRDERVLQLVRALTPASMIAVPLIARDRLIGAINLFTDSQRPCYEENDLAHLVEFARLAVLTIENCSLHRTVVRELAERERAEERLTRLLALHRATLESTTDGLLVVDTTGHFVSYNHQFVEMWGIPEGVAVDGEDARAISFVLHQLRDPEGFLGKVRELYATPYAESFDVLELTGGRIFERYSRPHWVEGHIAGRVWSFRDVTERTHSAKLQQLLAEASNILASSLDYTDTLDGIARCAIPLLAEWCRIFLTAEDGRLHPIAEAYVGSEPAGRRERARVAQPLAADSQHPAAVAMRTGEPVLLTELDDEALASLRSTSGEFPMRGTPQSWLAIPLAARGRRTGAMTFVLFSPGRRHTPLEVNVAVELARRSALAADNARLYEAALMANQAKSDFLAVMSHELRTPLTAIMGYTELMIDGISGPVTDVQQKQLKRIDASARHLVHLIEGILSFARVEAGSEKVHVELVDLHHTTSEAVVLVHPAAIKKGLRVVTEVPSGLPPIHTDPGKLRQILINLLSNAVKFTERGTVGVAVQREPSGARVRVWDTGIGIASDHLERIFDPFWQVEQAHTRHTGGTGLGLSVTRHLARLLGGDVEVTSRLGEGSTFTVYLPDLDTAQATESAGT
ncbi:MAG TPA: ATP-binding protein [Gemmatimonadaceae bacterium]|nr:ATP-binding protein [Gemmatimonadaceae bacterium]